MTTVREIVAAAHRKLALLASGEEMPGEMAADGLFAYNAMLHGWKAQGVDVTHTDQVLSDDFALGAEHVEGTIYMLASRLGPDYMVPKSFDYSAWWRSLQAEYATVPTLTVPTALLRPPSREDRDGNLPSI